MAERVVNDSAIDFSPPANVARGQELGHIEDACAEAFGAVGVSRVVFQQLTVFFQQRTAAGGVDDDRGRPVSRQKALEGVDVPAGQLAGGFQIACVGV